MKGDAKHRATEKGGPRLVREWTIFGPGPALVPADDKRPDYNFDDPYGDYEDVGEQAEEEDA